MFSQIGLLEAFEDHREVTLVDFAAMAVAFARRRKVKRALLQTLVEDRETVVIPPEDLDAITTPVAKHEEMPARRRLPDDRADHPRETVERSTHVRRFEAEKNADGGWGGESQHVSTGRPQDIKNTAQNVRKRILDIRDTDEQPS